MSCRPIVDPKEFISLGRAFSDQNELGRMEAEAIRTCAIHISDVWLFISIFIRFISDTI